MLVAFHPKDAGAFEVVAGIIAMLAYPEAIPDGPKVSEAQVAFGAHLMRAAMTADAGWALRPQWIKPVYLLQSEIEVARTVVDALNRLHRTLQSARVARPFIASARGERPVLPPGIARLSLNQAIAWVLDAQGEKDANPHNFEQRIFARTKRVLHLAVALEQTLHQRQLDTGKPPSLEAILIGDGAAEAILGQAEALESVVLGISEFRIDANELVRLRWAVGSSAPPNG